MLYGPSEILFEPWVQKDAKKQFKEVIQDNERSKKAMNTLDEMSRDAKNYTKDLEKAGKKLEKLVKDYHSTREDFDQLYSEMQGKREVAAARILALMPDLKRNILRQEWEIAFERKQKKP
jgi:galactokinase